MTTAKQKNVPALRFSEFEEEWELNKLSELATFSKGKGISKSDISENGKLECIRYGELYTHYNEIINKIKSRTNLESKSLTLSKKNDVIIPASGETAVDIATASCVINEGIALGGDLNIIRTKLNGVFLSYCLNSSRKFAIARLAQGSSVKHLYASQLKLLKVNFPILSEQQKIANFLTAIDEKIQQLTQKKSLLEQYKKGVMQQIFKQKIRFKDEMGKAFPEWEMKKLGELTTKTGKKNKENIKYPVYSINNKEGFLPQGDQFEGMDSNERGFDISNYKVIKENTFAYNPARINVGSIGFSGKLNNVLISSLYVCFQTKKALNDSYLLQYLDTYDFNKAVLRNGEGGVRIYLFYENFSIIKIPLPSLEEQQKIVDFLNTVDLKIKENILQLERVQAFKKGLLQQMFV